MSKTKINCPNCEEIYFVVSEDDSNENVQFCSFCAEPLDIDIEPLNF